MIVRRWIGLLALALGSACSPSGPDALLTGSWSARGIGHSLNFFMTLRQSGDEITGVACGVSDGVTIFSGVPVQGDYPRVRFVVTAETAGTCCSHLIGAQFDGRIDDTHDIVGSTTGLGSDLRFERTESTSCQ